MKVTMIQNQNQMDDVLSALFPAAHDSTPQPLKEEKERRRKVKKRIDFDSSCRGENKKKESHPKRAAGTGKPTEELLNAHQVHRERKQPDTTRNRNRTWESGMTVSKPIAICRSEPKGLGQCVVVGRQALPYSHQKVTGGKVWAVTDPHRQSPTNYAGAKFSESPSAQVLPPPPVHWVIANLALASPSTALRQESPQVKVFA